ncbi:ABATE domain-containing protein [Streptomyces sp. ISL-100]|uniref:CGNR zinc finger domain-containing protein n=1 Tax=Streptomyces sp. ISL-100 TaxID=2819173 RepID=UPI001BE50EBA|nr:ABATE domain-containing protein [Streptomyces sp. ISL-100]MBT2395629.1 ABATE domain-containing protein [Streptomyces sp. ISL-100]
MAAGSAGSCELRFDSGRVCLDLVATGGHPTEQLSGPRRLREWLVGAKLVPGDAVLDAVDDEWVSRFAEARAYVAELVHAQLQGRPAPRALDHINNFAATPPPGVRAVRTPDGAWVRALSDTPQCTPLLATVARDTVDLLTDPAARALLRQCEGDNCARLYLDTSRGRRRRWCSSEVCGNRERVARHRRRAIAAARA